MASEFIGYPVCITIRASPNSRIQGEVANVIGQRLVLRDVTFLWNGHRLPSYSVEGPDIADLSLETPKPAAVPSSSSQYAARSSPTVSLRSANNTTPQQPFVDPAILSFSKTSSPKHVEPRPSVNQTVTGSRPTTQQSYATPVARPADSGVSASLSEPFSNLALNADRVSTGLPKNEQNAQHDDDYAYEGTERTVLRTPVGDTVRRQRRGGRNKANGYGGAASTNPKSKGWRQTALVEPSHTVETLSFQPFTETTRARRHKKNRGKLPEEVNGWATEDATDIQELGEFDFQSNLSKFDKGRLFEQFRNGDTTAEEARLVAINRQAKPGTNGGKNLHWTENVLDSPRNSEAEETEEEEIDTRMSGGYFSGREMSRTSTRVQNSRKGSGMSGQPLVMPPQINTISRTQLARSHTTSPLSGKPSVSASPLSVPTSVPSGTLRLTTTNRNCPTLSPLQAFEIEQLAIAELGVSEDIITENAGRGIAEAAVSLLSDDAAAPTILIITGNHRTGARAIAAARHFRNRGHRVTLCIPGLERENEFLESCRRQLETFKRIGGRMLRWEELSTRLSMSDFNPDLVVDALLGIHVSFDEMRNDEQAAAYEMVSWINRANVSVLSVDVPSGLSASSGEVTMAESGRLCVNPSAVVCLGAPKSGIMNALLLGEGLNWHLTVADIGIPQVVWRKHGTRRRHGIDFGNRWVVPLRFQASTSA